jgi:hypothetical protein
MGGPTGACNTTHIMRPAGYGRLSPSSYLRLKDAFAPAGRPSRRIRPSDLLPPCAA